MVYGNCMMNRRLMIFDDAGYCMVIGMESWGAVGEAGCAGLNSGGMRSTITDLEILTDMVCLSVTIFRNLIMLCK